jgi:branched-chain amino acid transport system substrate-binding protein
MTESPHGARRARRRGAPALIALVAALTLIAAACGGGRDEGGSSSSSRATTPAGGTTGTGDNGNNGGASIIDTAECPSEDDFTAGISGDTIKLGTSLPQSGIYSTFKEILAGSRAYFEYVNEEQGGVEVAGKKYKIELVDKDDAYASERTVTNVNQLIRDEGVFALFDVVGTKNNLAIRDTVNEDCVPDVFAATGSPAWGNHNYPWVLGTVLVPYPLEAKAFVDYLKENKPSAKVAVLRANDEFGRAYADTFKKLIEGTQITLTKEETYDPDNPDTKTQVTSLAASNADTFLLGATLLACPNALNAVGDANWKPLIYMSGTCTSKTLMGIAGKNGNNVLSVSPLLDPVNPENTSNEAMTLYKSKVKQYERAADVDNGIVAYGWSVAALMVETLKRTPTLDRPGLMETARTLSDVKGVGLELPEASWTVGADDWFLGENFNLVQYTTSGNYFKTLKFIKADDQTEEITPDDLING